MSGDLHLLAKLNAAGRDERLATGTLYLDAAKEIERMQMRLRDAHDFIGKLQVALSFWMPGVPAELSPLHDRIADDAYLLGPWYADESWSSPGAEQLGWIKVCVPDSSDGSQS